MRSFRHLVRDTLNDGFVFRTGYTCDRAGRSLVGQPLIAVNAAWTERFSKFFNKRFISAWLDEIGDDPFDAEGERNRLVEYAATKQKWLPDGAADAFAKLQRGYGSWRTPDLGMNLGIALLVPTLPAAAMWGLVFNRTDVYDLAQKKCISLSSLLRTN